MKKENLNTTENKKDLLIKQIYDCIDGTFDEEKFIAITKRDIFSQLQNIIGEIHDFFYGRLTDTSAEILKKEPTMMKNKMKKIIATEYEEINEYDSYTEMMFNLAHAFNTALADYYEEEIKKLEEKEIKTLEEEDMCYEHEYDGDIEYDCDCLVIAGEGAVVRYDDDGNIEAIYDEEKFNSIIEEENRKCKITNEDVAELILSVDKNEECVIKYFPQVKEKSDIEKLELLIEAKHKKLGIDWPTGEFEPLKVNLDAEHREIIPDAWMAELYRIAIIERADFSSEDIIKEETSSYEKFLNFIDENSATKFYDHILDRKDSDGWYSYADAKECEIIASYRKKDIALTLSEFSQDCNTLDAIDAVIKKASLDENMNENKDFYELMWLVNSIRKNILYYYDFYFADEAKRADLYDREWDDEEFEDIFTHEYTMHGYGGFIYSGWFVLDLIALIENAAARTARYVEDAMFEAHDVKYEDRNYIFEYMY